MGNDGVREVALPVGALLQRYAAGDGFADAYAAEIGREVSFASFVEAFYSTGVFLPEKLVLALLGRRSSKEQLRAMARGEQGRFAAWSVEARDEAQVLLKDDTGRTRSWLHCAPLLAGGTRLYFGSAVVSRADPRTGEGRMGAGFDALLGFHRAYSRALLRAARKALA